MPELHVSGALEVADEGGTPSPAPERSQVTEADELAVASLAERTQHRLEIVRQLYERELATLRSQATVKNYLRIFAAKRVKERLLASCGSEPGSR